MSQPSKPIIPFKTNNHLVSMLNDNFSLDSYSILDNSSNSTSISYNPNEDFSENENFHMINSVFISMTLKNPSKRN